MVIGEAQTEEMFNKAVELHQVGKFDEAGAIYSDILASQRNHPGALHLLGLVRQQTGKPDEAIKLLKKAVTLAPMETSFRFNYATILLELERYQESVRQFRKVLRKDPDRLDARFSMATAAHELGRFEDAIKDYRIVIEAKPDFVEAQNNMGFALIEVKNFEEAAQVFRRSIEQKSDDPEVHCALGAALEGQGLLDEAIVSYRQATALGPDYDNAHKSLLSALARRAAAIDPAQGSAAYKGADPEVLTFRALGYNEDGDTAHAMEILDYDRLIHEVQNVAPSGYETLSGFHADLTRHLLSLESLKESPANHATRNGQHSGDILGEPKGPVAQIEEMIENGIRDYKLTHPVDDAHPFLAHQPDSWRLGAWTVVMRPQGHQIAHLHPEGWLSGVYYVELPPVVSKDKDQEGWIEFGRAPVDIPLKKELPTVRVQPKEGLMVLFPSYFYHQTIPYSSAKTLLPLANPVSERRICIAFDVMPNWG